MGEGKNGRPLWKPGLNDKGEKEKGASITRRSKGKGKAMAVADDTYKRGKERMLQQLLITFVGGIVRKCPVGRKGRDFCWLQDLYCKKSYRFGVACRKKKVIGR